MRVNDPLQYLAVRGFHPDCIIECALCTTKFRAGDGVAYPAQNNGTPITAYVCSDACFLAHVPVTCCARAS